MILKFNLFYAILYSLKDCLVHLDVQRCSNNSDHADVILISTKITLVCSKGKRKLMIVFNFKHIWGFLCVLPV